MRLTSLALAAVLAAASLTGCSDDDELSKEELGSALLTVGDLSDDFEIDDEADEEDDDEGPDWGCLDFSELDEDAAGDDDDSDSDHEREIAFLAKKEPGMPGVFHLVVDTGSEGAADEGMDALGDVLTDCTEVDSTEDDGTRWQFQVESDRVAWADGADEQINLMAIGSTSTDDFELPIVVHLNVVRVDQALAIFGFFDMAEDTGSAPRSLLDAASARLAAVVDGRKPPKAEPLLEDYPIGEAFEELLAEQDEPA